MPGEQVAALIAEPVLGEGGFVVPPKEYFKVLQKICRDKEPATAFTKQLVNRCREKGLLMISAGTYANIIRPLMPLVVTDDQLERGLSIIEEALAELSK
ncbi:MAG: aminotransferase class III-fold pyridoxal phosphate-dependent enzyme [Thermodesulfobacteriota bacterium]